MKNDISKDWRKCILHISIGIIYIWFGLLKFFPDVSPAEALAKQTIDILSLGLIPSSISYTVLAVWETVIGILLLLRVYPKYTICLSLIHMLGTFMPLIIISDVTFASSPMSLTLVGQYIMKNLIIVAALLAIYPLKLKSTKI